MDMTGQQWLVFSNNVSDGMLESCPGNIVLECVIPKFPLPKAITS
jgi:hypothetical protein